MKINAKRVKIFRIKNRKGYAALCLGHLTEGRTVTQAYDRMGKALKRTGKILDKVKANRIKKLVTK